MGDLDENNYIDENFVYNDDIPSKENIHQINTNLNYSHSILCNVLLLSQNYHCRKWLGDIIICCVII